MALLRGVRIPLLAVGLLAAASPTSPPTTGPAPGPPNGTYVYALSRNGGAQGTTSVVIYRRDDLRQIETSESGSAGAARMLATGAFRYADLGIDAYAGTYQAPFLRGSPLGRTYRFRTTPNFEGQWTVRYRAAGSTLIASIDGSPFVDRLDVASDAKRFVRTPWLFDAPFMTGALLLPAFRHRSGEASLAPVSEAFPSGIATAGLRIVRSAPTFPKTPKNDVALDVPGLARVWFDPATYVVHEVHFFAANFDARLISYVKGPDATPFAGAALAAPTPALPRETATFDSADGTSLAALVSRPADAKARVPAIVFVPPGPAGATDYDSDGPSPMFPALALAFVQRGYAVLRYDMRGVGKSGGSTATQTWDQALADAGAAFAQIAGDPAIDPKRIFLIGYGNGADLALAASTAASAGVRPAGVVALAPTVLAYRNCAAAVAGGAGTPADAAWRRSTLSHDPTVLAARAVAPLLILHPGEPVCGETKDQVDAYDDRLREANPLATIVAATDLTRSFGSRYEAESIENTEAFFPYRFDASTASAIADWLDAPKTAAAANASRGLPAGARAQPPPPPPGVDKSGSGLPDPHRSGATPSPMRSVSPGMVLPSGMTPPPDQVAPPTPIATPGPTATPAPAPAITAAPTPGPETTTAPQSATPLPIPSATAS